MILVDNNILSTFTRVEALELLFDLFRRAELGVTPAVYGEVIEAISQGCVRRLDLRRLCAMIMGALWIKISHTLPPGEISHAMGISTLSGADAVRRRG